MSPIDAPDAEATGLVRPAPAQDGTPSPVAPRSAVSWTASVLAGGAALVALTGAAAPWLWLGELAVHWSAHAACGLLPALALALWRRRWRTSAALTLVALLALVPALRALAEPRLAPPPAPARVFAAAFANVYDFNRGRERALAAVAALDAEVVGLTEVSAHDRPAFAGGRWPFQHWEDREDVLSVALLSVHPIVTATLHDVAGAGVLAATLDLGGAGRLRVLVAHLFSPKTGAANRRRDEQLRAVARLAAAGEGPLLLLGDLNITPASPAWRAFIGDSGLRRAPGPSPASWPAQLGAGGIAIDHLLGRGLGLSDVAPVAIPGGDHRGLRGTVWLGIRE